MFFKYITTRAAGKKVETTEVTMECSHIIHIAPYDRDTESFELTTPNGVQFLLFGEVIKGANTWGYLMNDDGKTIDSWALPNKTHILGGTPDEERNLVIEQVNQKCVVVE